MSSRYLLSIGTLLLAKGLEILEFIVVLALEKLQQAAKFLLIGRRTLIQISRVTIYSSSALLVVIQIEAPDQEYINVH